jgi:hypothetical protein
MQATLTIVRYKKRFIPMALLSMALFRWPLWRSKKIGFYKLMGSGKNGTFDKTPDWQQWAIMAVFNEDLPQGSLQQKDYLHLLYGRLIGGWLRLFRCEVLTLLLNPIEGHGQWDGQQPFGALPKQSDYAGPIAVLTRATIRLGKLRSFWQNVPAVASRMANAEGFINSFGIGEIPWVKQATFSVWQSKEAMRQFAYKMQEHAEVVRKTYQEKWYSEEMFVRFIILETAGSLQGNFF